MTNHPKPKLPHITITLPNSKLRITELSPLEDLEHALLLTRSPSSTISTSNLTLLRNWTANARRHHISITTNSTHLLLDVRSLPDALITEILCNIVHYDLPHHHLPILQRENTRRQFRLSLEKRASSSPAPISSENTPTTPASSPTPDPIPTPAERLDSAFYRLLLKKVPPHEIDFVTRFCAEHSLNVRRQPPRMSKELRSRRLSTLTHLASQTDPQILLAADSDRIFSILQTDPPNRLKWFRHAFSEGELIMLPDHINQLCDWLHRK